MTQNHTYMTQDELAAFNQANDTKLKGEHYLAVNPKTGEEGAWMFTSQTGWTDASKLGGPRTHYEDGTPVADFSYRKDWDPNWSIRLNDISNWAGGQGGGAGRTMLSEDQLGYAGFNDPYWRTSEGRNWVTQAAISGRSLEEIYREMAQMGERADKVNAIKSGANPLVSADRENRGMMSQQNSNAFNQAHQQEKSSWDIGSDVPQDYVDKITAEVDANWDRHAIVGKTGDNRYMFGDADLPAGTPPPPNDGSEYQWIGSMGWTKVGGFTPRDRQLAIETSIRNNYGYDDIEVDAMRVANTGELGWFMGGDQGGYMDIAPHDKDDILRMFGEEGYNPYYGRGWNNSEWRTRMTELKGGDESYLDPWKNRTKGNMMDYLFDKTKRTTGNRWNVKHAFNKWMSDNGVREVNLFNQRMTPRIYKQMGLQDILGDYDAGYNDQFSGGGTGNPLIARARAEKARQENDPSARRGFLGSYLDTKDKIAERTSVKSLFKEMEGFEGE